MKRALRKTEARSGDTQMDEVLLPLLSVLKRSYRMKKKLSKTAFDWPSPMWHATAAATYRTYYYYCYRQRHQTHTHTHKSAHDTAINELIFNRVSHVSISYDYLDSRCV